jgi:hypothetical protein
MINDKSHFILRRISAKYCVRYKCKVGTRVVMTGVTGYSHLIHCAEILKDKLYKESYPLSVYIKKMRIFFKRWRSNSISPNMET